MSRIPGQDEPCALHYVQGCRVCLPIYGESEVSHRDVRQRVYSVDINPRLAALNITDRTLTALNVADRTHATNAALTRRDSNCADNSAMDNNIMSHDSISTRNYRPGDPLPSHHESRLQSFSQNRELVHHSSVTHLQSTQPLGNDRAVRPQSCSTSTSNYEDLPSSSANHTESSAELRSRNSPTYNGARPRTMSHNSTIVREGGMNPSNLPPPTPAHNLIPNTLTQQQNPNPNGHQPPLADFHPNNRQPPLADLVPGNINLNAPIPRTHDVALVSRESYGADRDASSQDMRSPHDVILSTAEPARRPSSLRQTLDSLIKATKKKFSVRGRRTSPTASPSHDPTSLNIQASGPSHTQNVIEGNAGAAASNLAHVIIPRVIPVMNMGPGTPPHSDAEEFDDSPMSMPHIRAHTTVDYLHYLVPGLVDITNCGFYWGVMDRYEAEALLDDKPEGTFLLRDSSQDDFIFSVSFRRYGRSLHARVEQWNHRFSFDAHDSGVYKADSVTSLLEHYKNPQTCMFFEPMLTRPLNRPHTFSLLHLARAVVCDNVTYDAIDHLSVPKQLQEYCRYYHYKQKIRVRTHSSNNSRELPNKWGGHYANPNQ